MKRKFTLLLALAMLLASVSCGSEGSQTETTAGGDTTTATVVEESPFVKDELPELNYNGDEVSWFCGDYMNAYISDIWAESENGNMVNDAIFRARRNVEDRLNISLRIEEFDFDWGTLSTYTNLIKSMVMSGDTTYDAYVGYPANALVIEGGYFNDLNTAKYLDLDKPWWNQACREVMPDDTTYFMNGDATLTLVKHVLCIYFNQELLDSFKIEDDMYELVRSGKWTVDKMESLIKDTYGDLNGNNEYDIEDRYGLTFGDNNKYRQLPAAMNVTFSTKTNDGYEFTFINERSETVFTKLQSIINTNEAVRKAGGNNDNNLDSFASFGGNYVSKIFTSGNSLFSASLVGDAASVLDNSKFTVGMIPFPKFDEAQDDYYTAAQRGAGIYIPSTVVDTQLERSSAILEAWASECYRNVMPTYFETSLKTRYSTDNDMAEMFDLLRTNIVYNIDYAFSTELDLNVDFFKKLDQDGLPFASTVEGMRESSEQKLEKLVAALKGED